MNRVKTVRYGMIWTHNLIENFLVIASVDLEPFNFFDVHRTGMIRGSMGRRPIFLWTDYCSSNNYCTCNNFCPFLMGIVMTCDFCYSRDILRFGGYLYTCIEMSCSCG